jgi:hypothetical protein
VTAAEPFSTTIPRISDAPPWSLPSRAPVTSIFVLLQIHTTYGDSFVDLVGEGFDRPHGKLCRIFRNARQPNLCAQSVPNSHGPIMRLMSPSDLEHW